jgi:hypothetical protein
MGLDIWFREDVARILAAAHETRHFTAHATPPLDPERAQAYARGFDDALRALAVAFGLAGPTGSVDSEAEGPVLVPGRAGR